MGTRWLYDNLKRPGQNCQILISSRGVLKIFVFIIIYSAQLERENIWFPLLVLLCTKHSCFCAKQKLKQTYIAFKFLLTFQNDSHYCQRNTKSQKLRQAWSEVEWGTTKQRVVLGNYDPKTGESSLFALGPESATKDESLEANWYF